MIPTGTRVTYGTRGVHGGDNLGQVVRSERKWQQDGYLITPLSRTTGDGYSTRWYPAGQVWTSGVENWTYDAMRNTYRRTA